MLYIIHLSNISGIWLGSKLNSRQEVKFHIVFHKDSAATTHRMYSSQPALPLPVVQLFLISIPISTQKAFKCWMHLCSDLFNLHLSLGKMSITSAVLSLPSNASPPTVLLLQPSGTPVTVWEPNSPCISVSVRCVRCSFSSEADSSRWHMAGPSPPCSLWQARTWDSYFFRTPTPTNHQSVF